MISKICTCEYFRTRIPSDINANCFSGIASIRTIVTETSLGKIRLFAKIDNFIIELEIVQKCCEISLKGCLVRVPLSEPCSLVIYLKPTPDFSFKLRELVF